MVRRTFGLIFLVFFVFLPHDAYANYLRPLPLEKKVHNSDLVAVGVITSTQDVVVQQRRELRYQKVNITRVLKGAAKGEIWLLVEGSIPEENLACCEPGKVYLIFLKSRGDGRYSSVNGNDGMLALN